VRWRSGGASVSGCRELTPGVVQGGSVRFSFISACFDLVAFFTFSHLLWCEFS